MGGALRAGRFCEADGMTPADEIAMLGRNLYFETNPATYE
jgi:hypothetical protein